MNTNERSMRMRIASYQSWAKTPDRSARTAAARKRSHHTRFVEKARELHPGGTEKQIADAAEALKKAHYTEMARRSAQSRRIRSEIAKDAKQKQIARALAGDETAAA
ncbi:hypothetical protein ACH4VM_02725 [Streptomyces sp. NPDC020792]|uniref:hypothetical protein n=1 Tax=Streptomyces sp. NPDC020792 TaxID=3365089 RepID=UPI0037BB8432